MTICRTCVLFTLLTLSTVLIAACDQAGSTTAMTRPTTAPAKLVSFNGTLQLQATDAYSFAVTQDGYVEVTLIGLGAPPATTVELGVGTASATGGCAASHTVTAAAGPAAQIIGTGLAGNLCVTIRDTGNLTSPAIYTITIAAS